MNPDPLLDRLLAAARRTAVADRVPYAFEKRIMARLPAAARPDAWAAWAHGLWRAAASGFAVLVLSGLWAAWPAAQAADLDDALDSAIAAALPETPEEL
ncbi:MAG: hypothetical protein ACKVYV_14800 [Limisphaerales bacterium]